MTYCRFVGSRVALLREARCVYTIEETDLFPRGSCCYCECGGGDWGSGGGGGG